ncbi:hypothetical protein N0Y54_42355 [Nostoc punctiforme UO1]|uniref:hypothetical protein n=1 Tax=Nostoc punctiforme TaxID=272131 RepID=UPI00309E46B1
MPLQLSNKPSGVVKSAGYSASPQEKTQQNLHAQNVECTRYRYTIGTEIQQIITEATL